MAGKRAQSDGLPRERCMARFSLSTQEERSPAAINAQPKLSPTEVKDQEDWETLVTALRQNRRQLLRLPGVTAVDVGFKIKDGVFTETLALRVHVERKLHESELKSGRLSELFYKDKDETSALKLRFNNQFLPLCEFLKQSGINLDVVEGVYQPAGLPGRRPQAVLQTPANPKRLNRQRRIEPLVGGISIGGPQASFGTLGALVWDNSDGSVCILSNWHVLAGHPQTEPGTPCLQPGPFDRGRLSDVVARLKRWSFDSRTDAAIAELTGDRRYCAGEILDLAQPISGTIAPHLGMRLIKSGRSTGTKDGFVDGLYFSSAIEYASGVVQIFEDQIHIAPLRPDDRISEPGDSGAVWVTRNGEAVGLHFAGDQLRSAFGEYALANPMIVVESQLDFSFRPVYLEIRDDDVLSLPLSRIELEEGARRNHHERERSGSGHETGDQIRIPPGGQ